ncbi:hypothetical protein [Paraburkholderia phenoliruptrix]|uniref:hypothetical protein n=1 Tax=Paraburkholderia phenoliruptrix TaxID=252970 RepID=UPI001C6EBD78|nr:hypothetical protein [Paraburkholderia phenoliruptrix]MBW9102897.1 hypothetical protein [Paraburkholderia phenoliruptrix]MBW9132870.1 hypothetical protein [Paraburkholderia ginsengiterrae]
MDEPFDISAPETPTTGDFLSFRILDGDRPRKGRISGTALALLGNGTREEAFLANIDRIRAAAYRMCRAHPTVDVVTLGSDSFS